MKKSGLSSTISVISLILIIIGALNWGLWGFFQFDLVAWIFHGNTTGLARTIYAIVGLAGIWSLRFLGRCGALCCSKGSGYGKGSCSSSCGKEDCPCCKAGTCPCGKEGCTCSHCRKY